MLLELAVPGFVICFFGLSAATVGGLRIALGEGFTPSWQFAAFSFFSILYLVVLRRCLKRIFVGDQSRSADDFDNGYVGRIGAATEAIGPSRPGRVLLGDAEWTAIADTPIASGASVKVIAQDNLTMKVVEI